MPPAPKVFSNALSSNSPTTCGRICCRSNHCSMRVRTAACWVGNNTGTRPSDCGKPRRASVTSDGGAYQASVALPSAWLYSFRFGFGAAARSARTTSSRCSARSPSRSSNSSWWHSSRNCGSCITGCSKRHTASLGIASEMPTASRTPGARTASRSTAGNCSPSWKIRSACCIAARPASVNARPRPAGLSNDWPSARLELAHLRAHGLYRHAQAGRSTRDAAFLRDDPEVVQVPVTEVQAHAQVVRKCCSMIFLLSWKFRADYLCALHIGLGGNRGGNDRLPFGAARDHRDRPRARRRQRDRDRTRGARVAAALAKARDPVGRGRRHRRARADDLDRGLAAASSRPVAGRRARCCCGLPTGFWFRTKTRALRMVRRPSRSGVRCGPSWLPMR